MIAAHGPHADVNLSRVGFLIVDDKPMSREMAHTALIGRARKVRQTMSVEKAAEILAQPDTDVECIVADWAYVARGRAGTSAHDPLPGAAECRSAHQFCDFHRPRREAAVKCAVELDVNGFAAAPLSLDKLARTIGAAVARTWNLQDIGHYASVPCVVPPPAPSQPIVSRTPVTTAGASGRSPFGHVQAHGRRPGVRMCGLNDVQPGLILARDIRDVHGTLLLRTGTALEAPIIDRLRKAAGAARAAIRCGSAPSGGPPGGLR